MNDTKSDMTVILGGAGKTGRRVAERLEAGGHRVRVASRSTGIPFDWSDPVTWPPALAGAHAIYLSYYPDLAVPGAAEQIRDLMRVAAAQDVRHVVLLAGRGEPQVHPAEQAVRDSGIPFTILECAFFCQNFDEGIAAPVDDTVAFVAGDVREPFIDCDDIAAVAVAALTDPVHAGKTYELTGPHALTFAEATEQMATAAGRPLRYQQLSFEDYGQLLAQELPRPHVDFFLDLFRFLLDGHNAHTTGDVERVLGRPARDFRTYAQHAAAAWQ